MKRGSITAGELIAKLESDPEYQRKKVEREARMAPIIKRHRLDEAAVVSEIRAAGYAIDSISDLVNTGAEYPGAVGILIQHLDVPHESGIRESIVRALTVKYGGVALEEALLRHFKDEQDSNLRWVFANALKTAMPLSRRKKHPEIEAVFRPKGRG